MLSLLRYVPCSLATPTSNAPSPTPSRRARRRHLRLRCAAEDPGGASSSLNDLVSEQVDLLLRREENKHLLDGLEGASRRVEDARRALDDIERQEIEAARAKEAILELQKREAEITESQKAILEAKAMVEEAERSLSSSLSQTNSGEDATDMDDVDSHMERLESIKAAAVSSIVGVLAALPISMYQTSSSPQLFQHLVIVFISSALFGVTFRYAVRRDVDNIQLKTGTSAAFGFVQGLAALEVAKPLEFSTASLISQVFDGAAYVSTSFLVFIFSSVALDFCFKNGFLSPFPIRK